MSERGDVKFALYKADVGKEGEICSEGVSLQMQKEI